MKKIFILSIIIFSIMLSSCNAHIPTDDSYSQNDLDFYEIFECFESTDPYYPRMQAMFDEGIISPHKIYAQYCQMWRDEMVFTLEKSAILFENESEYLQWKESLTLWMESTLSIYQKESSHMIGQTSSADIGIRCAELIRAKVLDAKFFCFTLEWQNGVRANFVSLQWNPQKAGTVSVKTGLS